MDLALFDLWYAEANNDFEMGDILFNAGKYNGSVFYYIQVSKKQLNPYYIFLESASVGTFHCEFNARMRNFRN